MAQALLHAWSPGTGIATPPLTTSNSPKSFTSTLPRLYCHAPKVRPMTRCGVIELTRPPQGHVSGTSGTERRLSPGPRTARKGRTMIEEHHLTKRYGKTLAVDQPVPQAQKPRAFTWARIAALLMTFVLLTGLTYLRASSSPETASVPQGAHAGQLT